MLLVDDEKVSRMVIAKLLQRCGYNATVAESGEEALELLAEDSKRFKLILTDVMMPGINGLELLKKIRENQDLQHVPVVMMSSQENAGTVFEGIRRGAEDYLLKPLTMKEVMHLWQHVWRRQMLWQKFPNAAEEQEEQDRKRSRNENGEKGDGLLDDDDDLDNITPGDLYTTTEMRAHCMRQIARYQRVLEVIDTHPHLFKPG